MRSYRLTFQIIVKCSSGHRVATILTVIGHQCPVPVLDSSIFNYVCVFHY